MGEKRRAPHTRGDHACLMCLCAQGLGPAHLPVHGHAQGPHGGSDLSGGQCHRRRGCLWVRGHDSEVGALILFFQEGYGDQRASEEGLRALRSRACQGHTACMGGTNTAEACAPLPRMPVNAMPALARAPCTHICSQGVGLGARDMHPHPQGPHPDCDQCNPEPRWPNRVCL